MPHSQAGIVGSKYWYGLSAGRYSLHIHVMSCSLKYVCATVWVCAHQQTMGMRIQHYEMAHLTGLLFQISAELPGLVSEIILYLLYRAWVWHLEGFCPSCMCREYMTRYNERSRGDPSSQAEDLEIRSHFSTGEFEHVQRLQMYTVHFKTEETQASIPALSSECLSVWATILWTASTRILQVQPWSP